MTDEPLDSLIDELRAIVEVARDHEDRAGYFAAMYLGVTTAVSAGLADGRFAEPERLAGLTRAFAQRYLDAVHLHQSGGTPPVSWAIAFDATTTWRPTVLQHLLLGMNAHINLDLGAACAAVAPGVAIDDLRSDFLAINGVLADLVRTVQDRLDRVSPLYRFVDDVSADVDRSIVNFSITRARDAAWRFATTLAMQDPAEVPQRIVEQDRAVGALADHIIHPGFFAAIGLLAVRVTEKRHPRTIIEILGGPPPTPP